MSELIQKICAIGGLVCWLFLFALTSCTKLTKDNSGNGPLKHINHFVVIYQENHSFDNLFGRWEKVNGLDKTDTAHTIQIGQKGLPFACLPQTDPNLQSPPLAASCKDKIYGISSAFQNRPFKIEEYIPPTASTCKNGSSQGCTRDLVHKFYQSQYQINGGRMNRFVAGSDAVGLTMGFYDTKTLPIYRYLHRPNHPPYVIADNFFQAAFGGSFLNHQWLIAARTPEFKDSEQNLAVDLHSKIDSNGMPVRYPLYTPDAIVKDAELTVVCREDDVKGTGIACGDYAVNTIQPQYQPHAPNTERGRLPPQKGRHIGAALTEGGIDWAWYSGGWSNADGDIGSPGWTNGKGPRCSDPNTLTNAVFPNCPDRLFQFHHQPFNYFAGFDPATSEGRSNRKSHLKDEMEFVSLAKSSNQHCLLKPVSFVKSIGEENEHPGYASEYQGNDHLVELISLIENSACAKDTMIIVTYDEFGGFWDHVSPPAPGINSGPYDQWGPGVRIPTLLISPFLETEFAVDHTSYDTTSILATIEHRFELRPLASRDAKVNNFSNIFNIGGIPN